MLPLTPGLIDYPSRPGGRGGVQMMNTQVLARKLKYITYTLVPSWYCNHKYPLQIKTQITDR